MLVSRRGGGDVVMEDREDRLVTRLGNYLICQDVPGIDKT